MGRYYSTLLPRQDGVTFQIQVNRRLLYPELSPFTVNSPSPVLSILRKNMLANTGLPYCLIASLEFTNLSSQPGMSHCIDLIQPKKIISDRDGPGLRRGAPVRARPDRRRHEPGKFNH